MEISWTNILGTIASGLAILSLMPQVIRTWRTQSAHDLSLGWLLIALLSMALWIAYGLAVGAPAVVCANAAMSLQVLLILWVKLRQAQRPDPGTRN